eukprot:1159441-Pelagomonas_calceolata.AAC.5
MLSGIPLLQIAGYDTSSWTSTWLFPVFCSMYYGYPAQNLPLIPSFQGLNPFVQPLICIPVLPEGVNWPTLTGMLFFVFLS